MRRRARQPVEPAALLEAHGDRRAPRQVDDLLQSRSAGALGDQDAIEWTARL
jgi:hypothetical protein